MSFTIVELKYEDLINNVDLSPQIGEAFGVEGIGVLTVSGVPNYLKVRADLLPLARQFASLPDNTKEKYVHQESFYSFGWSHGKEKLQGKPDFAKGSYYNNPQYDKPIEDVELINKYSSFLHPNIWPTDDLPELEAAFKALGQLIVNVGVLVARQCDRYVNSKCSTYHPNSLENVISSSLVCKARLLHYFPLDDAINTDKDLEFSSWCGWHNDHGSLTGLTSAMYLNEEGNIVQNTDPTAGLYVRNRHSELVKINIPEDHLGFQIGETAQVHSGGYLQATPHAVRGSNMLHVSRETFAVFMEPNWMEPMVCPANINPEQAQTQSAAANLPTGVPPLATRWSPSMNPPQTFAQFSEATHKSYY
eukprot:gene5441-7534_t